MTSSVSSVQAPAEKTSFTGAPPIPGRGLVATYMAITAIVLALLMVFGLIMRASQAGFITVPPNRFYQLLTAHGRAQPIRGDQDVDPKAPSPGRYRDAIAILAEPVESAVEPDVDAVRQRRVEQRLIERAAPDRHRRRAEGARMRRIVDQAEQLAVLVVKLDARGDDPLGADRIGKTESAQRIEPVWRQRQEDALGTHLTSGALFEHHRFVAHAPERDGQCQAADAGAGDADCERPGLSPCVHQRSVRHSYHHLMIR